MRSLLGSRAAARPALAEGCWPPAVLVRTLRCLALLWRDAHHSVLGAAGYTLEA